MKILFIACYSPLINNSAAIETLQYLNKLSEINGNEVHLLTVNFPKNSIYYDEYLFSMMDTKIKCHLIGGGPVFKKLMPRKSSEDLKTNVGKRKKILRKIKNSLVIPDMYYGWAKKASTYGMNLMKNEKFDVIFSMHEPPSSHLCAYYIKKKFKDIPWITYWSDPWLKDSTRQKSFIVKKIIESKMERDVVDLADKFIFVTEENRKDYIKEYTFLTQKQTYVLNRGFDKGLYEKLSLEETPNLINNNKVNVVYAGEIFSKLRNINPFIEALEELKNENKEYYNMLNVLFFGNIDDVEGKKRLEKLDIAKVSSRIPFNEALKYMLNSEVLLLFGNKNSKQIPAKIYDYFGTNGKIFIIYGDENDPIKDVVENHEKCITSINSSKDIKNNLYKLIDLYKADKITSNPDYRYEWNSIVNKLNNILEEK
ncbi:glycosyl transferase group 1 [Clostridium weizhouense]|uniref:Glycosyl transferase group 1 n=1 Tax=Clostridium weizhouense TaxID=2859781 RepID=A0ABS7AQI8_9CLOT|nr:glycosyl transferase group 1 [Clostridium weizhouense]MBW6410892.1 glycosyl transferase group 1 [Clostridium weizhouense]